MNTDWRKNNLANMKPARIPPQTPPAGGKKAEAGRILSPRQIASPCRVQISFRDFRQKMFELRSKNTAMTKKKIITVLLVLVIIALVAILAVRLISPEDNWICNKIGNCIKHGNPSAPAPKTGLPNPASVHCEEVGGTLEIRNDASGGQVGFCTLPDKSVCEEWALLRNECADNSEHFLHLNIKPGDTISNPLKITGESGGGWFFEGSFPINLVDWDGKIIAEGLAKAKGNWMTANFVPFEAELKFTKPANPNNQDFMTKGAIIFRKDNPSGLPANDAAYELPVRF